MATHPPKTNDAVSHWTARYAEELEWSDSTRSNNDAFERIRSRRNKPVFAGDDARERAHSARNRLRAKLAGRSART